MAQTNNISFRIKSDYLLAGILVFLCRILLDILYCYAISSTNGFEFVGINIAKLFETYLLLILGFIFLSKSNNKISSLILQAFFLFIFIPLLTYYSFNDVDRSWLYACSFFWIFVNILNRIKLEFSIKLLAQRRIFFWLIVICVPCASLYLLWEYYGLHYNFDFSKVYQIRAAHEQISVPFFFEYLLSWSGKIVIPFLTLWALYNRPHRIRWLIFFLAVSVQVTIFAITGHKIYLFNIPFIIVLSWLIRRRSFFVSISFAVFCLFCGGIFVRALTTDLWYNSLIVRRIFLVPAQISFYYYDFFKDKPIYLSNSIFRHFFPYPYELAPPNLIGLVYFNDVSTHANNGIVADGFMNFGYMGIIIWAIALFLLLKLADKLTESKNRMIVYPLLILSFSTLANSYLLTTILTHGLFLSLVLVYFQGKCLKLPKIRTATL